NRSRFDVRLYSFSLPVGNVGALCRAAAETYVQLPGTVEPAVAKLRSEDLDMVLFASNLTAAPHLLTQIAAYRVAPVQVTTGASPVTTGLRNMDVLISGALNETGDAQAHYTEHLALLSEALNCYAFGPMLEGLAEPDPVTRAAYTIPEDAVLF